MGMPCCHAVKVMIHLGMLEIPAGNIVKHWTMDARDILPAQMIELESDKLTENSQSYRQSDLFILAFEFAKSCSRSDQTFEGGLAGLVQLEQDLLELKQVRDGSVLSEKCSRSAAQGSDAQGMSAAATYDATLAAQERRTEVEAPDPKCKIVQHTQAKGPQ
ncbi:uncharacterized protein LOC101761809 [Setaria italica]|nr:uncharacterized protein LOC101761809 [Setaria italica]